MIPGDTRSGASVDVGQVLDTGPWSMVQKMAVVLAALSIVLDGFDSQLIGFAIPVMIKEWGVTRGEFAPALAAGLFGMGLGSVLAGYFADRFGRRMALIGSVFLLGFATCAIGASQNVLMIAVLRFIAGLGIGGCLPSASTVAAEFTPIRRRTMAVTATIVCIPLGGMLAGVFANYVLPALGWRALFFIGGSLPLTLGVLLLLTIPESPRFLVRHPGRWDELRRLLGRMHRPTTADTVFTDLGEQKVESRAGFAAVFQQGRARDTLALSGAFFLCLLAVYSAFSWLPTMLTAEGLDIAVAGAGLTAYNLGGVFGALACAMLITRYGSRWPLALCCAGGAASAFFLTQVNVSNTNVLIFGLLVHGLCVNAVQATMYAVCAYAYPTNVRATGTAAALGFGRLGAILSSFAGAAVITAGGASGYLTMLGLAMLGALAALMVVRRHIPPLDRQNTISSPVRTASRPVRTASSPVRMATGN